MTSSRILCFGYSETSHRQGDFKKPGKRALFGEVEGEEDNGEISEGLTFDENGDTAEEELV